MGKIKLKIILKVMKWFMLHNLKGFSLEGLEKIREVHKHTIKQGKDFSDVVTFIIFVCEYLGVDIKGIHRVNDGLPYDNIVSVRTDSDSNDLWKDGKHIYSDLIYLKEVKCKNSKYVEYVPVYKKAINFYYMNGSDFQHNLVGKFDGIDSEQEIGCDAYSHSMFSPQTFDIEVYYSKDDCKYHIKDRHQLTAARKVYNIPNIKRAKEIKEINSF